jgi:ATP-dependent RNA helicase RhlE
MPFTSFDLHPDLLRGIRELGFTRPTPIQIDAIPPAMAGKDVLAAAATGSGKTAAFLLPIMHRLIGKKRGTTRALILTPTRELAAQIDEHLRDLAVHTPLSGAAIYGGVGMGPQEHAFRSGVDVLVATPGRLLDHFQYPYAKLDGLEILVLDEADRMLDMGFLPDIRRVLKHLPVKRQTLFFSATLPAPIVTLSQEMLKKPAMISIERKAEPASGIAQSVFPVSDDLKLALLDALLTRGEIRSAIVFTRTKHRANRVYEQLEGRRVGVARIHGNRSQMQRTDALNGFKSGKYRILVATDIAARGIDVEALSHVVNFDVPHLPEDYIHRVGRTARAEMTGDAITFVAPEEESDLRAIERAIGKRLPRVTVPDFDYSQKPAQKLEIPIQERIAAIRARKAEDRARAAAKVARRNTAQGSAAPAPSRGNTRGPQAPQRAATSRPASSSSSPRPRDGGPSAAPSPSRHRRRGR